MCDSVVGGGGGAVGVFSGQVGGAFPNSPGQVGLLPMTPPHALYQGPP